MGAFKQTEKMLKEYSNLIENPAALRTTNPSLPPIRCLSKIHKSDNEIREIIAMTNSPIQKIVRRLLQRFNELWHTC